MIVNKSNANIDLRKKYKNVTWLSQTVKPRNVVTYVDWLAESFLPAKSKPNRYTDFEICIEMLVKGKSKEECELTMSSIMSDFDSGELQLDNMNFTYDFDFKSEDRELVKRWLYSYKINLNAYSKKGILRTVEFTGKEKTLVMEGTAKSPAIVTIIPDIALVSFTVTGITDEAITIKDIARNAKVVIDGQNCTITENGRNILYKTDLWEFPRLMPGKNIITLDNSCSVKIDYRAFYR
jgi:phage-related protein